MSADKPLSPPAPLATPPDPASLGAAIMTDPRVKPDEVEFRDPQSGKLLGKIVNVDLSSTGEAEAQEEVAAELRAFLMEHADRRGSVTLSARQLVMLHRVYDGLYSARRLREYAESQLTLARQRADAAERVHLRRHTRLAVALGMDPGYSADATVNAAIERLARADTAEQDARLKALTEVHEFYEFDATTEEQFDAWLHERIKECRAALRASDPRGSA